MADVQGNDPAWELEGEYRAARDALATPPSTSAALLLLLSIAAFALIRVAGADPLREIIVIVVVLLFHELGHYVGMRGFGYRDVRMFFIPFFGAAVSGEARGVAAWKDGVVSLLGPLPGILLAGGLTLAIPAPSAFVRDAIATLLVINTLNLLPLGGFDGSRFLQRVIFSRQRHLEIAFLLVAGIALLVLSLLWKMWVLAIFAYLGLVFLRMRFRLLRTAATLRADFGGVSDVEKLDDARCRILFVAARETVHANHRTKAKIVAPAMKAIIEALQPPPGALATVGLTSVWLGGLVLAVVMLVAGRQAPTSAKPFKDYPVPGLDFVVSMPEGATASDTSPSGVASLRQLSVATGDNAYLVQVTELLGFTPPDKQQDFLDSVIKLVDADTIDGSAEPITRAGLPGRAVWRKLDGSPCRENYFVDEMHVIVLTGCTKPDDPSLARFLNSFRRARE
jgi:Zn-dependent protease